MRAKINQGGGQRLLKALNNGGYPKATKKINQTNKGGNNMNVYGKQARELSNFADQWGIEVCDIPQRVVTEILTW